MRTRTGPTIYEGLSAALCGLVHGSALPIAFSVPCLKQLRVVPCTCLTRADASESSADGPCGFVHDSALPLGTNGGVNVSAAPVHWLNDAHACIGGTATSATNGTCTAAAY